MLKVIQDAFIKTLIIQSVFIFNVEHFQNLNLN